MGDTVDVHCRILEGDKERIQIFNGLVIARAGSGTRETFTVRRIVQGEGVERKFPLHSPRIAKIEVKRSGVTRRAKLYYLRERTGKAVRLKERRSRGEVAGDGTGMLQPAQALYRPSAPSNIIGSNTAGKTRRLNPLRPHEPVAAVLPGKKLGQRGEAAAARYLRRRGYKILARGDRLGPGELDLVMLDRGKTIVFVEVKTRQSHDAGHPAEAVDAQAAAADAAGRHLSETSPPAGAAGPVRRDRRHVARGQVVPDIEHFKNAFEAVGEVGVLLVTALPSQPCKGRRREIPSPLPLSQTTNLRSVPGEGTLIARTPRFLPPLPAAGQGRMAVEKQHVQPMRIGIVLVEPGQLAKGREIGVLRAGPLQGIAVALPLEVPADGVLQRLQEHGEKRQNQHAPGQRVDRQMPRNRQRAAAGRTRPANSRSQIQNPAAL